MLQDVLELRYTTADGDAPTVWQMLQASITDVFAVWHRGREVAEYHVPMMACMRAAWALAAAIRLAERIAEKCAPNRTRTWVEPAQGAGRRPVPCWTGRDRPGG